MCLELTVVPTVTGSVSADTLSELSGLSVTKGMPHMATAFHFAREPGCSCSLLSDDADWESSTWAFDPAILDGLARAVQEVAVRAKGLTFEALWMGYPFETQEHVPLKRLLGDIRSNAIKNKHRYVVGSAAQQADAADEVRDGHGRRGPRS